MQIAIREATHDDLPGILALYEQPDMDNDKGLSLTEAEEIFSKMKSYPDYKVFVATDQCKIIGTFALAIMDNLAHKGARSGLIEDVVVKTGWQGVGIGKRMMEYAIERCRASGCYKAALSSNLKREKAHRFYESLGFEKHGYSFLIKL